MHQRGRPESAQHQATETGEPLTEKTLISLVGLKHSRCRRVQWALGRRGSHPESLHYVCICPCVSTDVGSLREGAVWRAGNLHPQRALTLVNQILPAYTHRAHPSTRVSNVSGHWLCALNSLHKHPLFSERHLFLLGEKLMSVWSCHQASPHRASSEPLDVEGVWARQSSQA